jgi:hypothetical protein
MSAALDFVLKRKALTAASLAAHNEALYSDACGGKLRYSHRQEKFRQLGDLRNSILLIIAGVFSQPGHPTKIPRGT